MKQAVLSKKATSGFSLGDCLEIYQEKGYCAICNDGKLEGFVKEPEGKPNESLKLIWLNAAI